jgi:TRAP-type C4-dicarboxylate transport system substrate-binding protein
MKKLFLVLLVIGLLVGLIFNGWAKEATAQTKVRELKWADSSPPNTGITKITQKWADMIGEKSGGRIKITCYWGESLAKFREMYRKVQVGIADFGYYVIGTDPGLLDLNVVLGLPFMMGTSSMSTASAIFEQLFNKFPEMRAQWQGVKPLGFNSMPPHQLSLIKKVVRVPQDIKGMKIGARGGPAEMINQVGGVPVTVPVGEIYMALERGVLEGWIMHFPGAEVFGTLPLLKYQTIFSEGGVTMGTDVFLANSDVWNSLPPDIQKIIDDATRWRMDEIRKFDTGEINRIVEFYKKEGHTFTYLTPQEIQLWQDAAKPVHEKWIADQEAKGLPAKAIYEEARQLIKKYTK